MKTLVSVLLLTLLVTTIVRAEEAPKADAKPDTKAQWEALYKTDAWWVHEIGGGKVWQKTKVASVNNDKAQLKLWTKFKADGQFEGDSSDSSAEYTAPAAADPNAKPDPKWKELGRGEETLVGLECTWVEGTYDGVKTKNWTSKKYGNYLTVRSDYAGETSMKLLEFHEGKATADSSLPGGDPFWQYKKVGNYWTTKTTMTKPMEMVTYVKFEITAVTDTEATYTMSSLDKNMKVTFEMKDQKMPLVLPKLPSNQPKIDPPKMTEEEVECKALGKITAQKMDVDSGGMKSTIWMWKGICVKMEMTSDDVASTTELWETNLK